jgi:hypothetical protein
VRIETRWRTTCVDDPNKSKSKSPVKGKTKNKP